MEAAFMADRNLCRAAAAIYAGFYSCPDKETFVKTFAAHLERLLAKTSPSLSADNLCGKITAYIQANYCSRLSLNDISEHFGHTSSYINRIFKKELGISPLQYITDLNIIRAVTRFAMHRTYEYCISSCVVCLGISVHSAQKHLSGWLTCEK